MDKVEVVGPTNGEPNLMCGIVMPISSIDGCSESHWGDVQDILSEAIEVAGFSANIVSNADDAGIIHKRIIQNLYDNPIVVCDVSGKNPNVMFELGMRLAFDKPTIIVKDDKTAYSFDTSSIEHLEYPRDLRFSKIVEFKQKLADKIRATHNKAQDDSSYSTFLKHFGEFKVAKLEKKEVSGQEFIIDELRQIRFAMRRMESGRDSGLPRARWASSEGLPRRRLNICLEGLSAKDVSGLMQLAEEAKHVSSVSLEKNGRDHPHLYVRFGEDATDDDFDDLNKTLRELVSKLEKGATKRPLRGHRPAP